MIYMRCLNGGLQYIKKMERKSKSTKSDSQKKINKINKQMDVLKNRKRKFINLLADGIITNEEYQESIEATNKDLTELMEQKNELLSLMESEDVIETIEKLKKELLQFLNFDELTEDILHRLINRIEVKEDGTAIIHYRFTTPKIE
ncbi:hypothetical protein CQJ30_04575 [Caldibacillus thermoamylovorans]|uniref:hypothetical protein n=1 Tax=Caldibacillus thermoamylovorans TaxID=35841 RepID=UPI000D5573B7|nr:hypothetical protein [Caldibacillus thermoamylovorans]AWI11511.1 hypothetical protein CQJ30_04575 [Caldibacillus thermoamylovorans]